MLQHKVVMYMFEFQYLDQHNLLHHQQLEFYLEIVFEFHPRHMLDYTMSN